MSGSNRLLVHRACGPLLGILLVALAGCQGMQRPLDHDPLMGGSPIPATPVGRLSGPGRSLDPIGKAAAAGDVPPVPPPVSSTSPAALTLGAVAPGGDRRTPAVGVTLQGPRPTDARHVPPVPDAASAAPTVPTARGAIAAGSFEDLQRQLKARGVVWQQLRGPLGESGEWHFICAIPNPQQSSMRRNYEARAPGPDGLAAIQAVLEQIDRERR